MEERISKKETSELTFEESGQKMKVTVELNNLYKDDVSKTKDLLETMFKEILSSI